MHCSFIRLCPRSTSLKFEEKDKLQLLSLQLLMHFWLLSLMKVLRREKQRKCEFSVGHHQWKSAIRGHACMHRVFVGGTHQPTHSIQKTCKNLHSPLVTHLAVAMETYSCRLIGHEMIWTNGAVNTNVFAGCLTYYCNTKHTISSLGGLTLWL